MSCSVVHQKQIISKIGNSFYTYAFILYPKFILQLTYWALLRGKSKKATPLMKKHLYTTTEKIREVGNRMPVPNYKSPKRTKQESVHIGVVDFHRAHIKAYYLHQLRQSWAKLQTGENLWVIGLRRKRMPNYTIFSYPRLNPCIPLMVQTSPTKNWTWKSLGPIVNFLKVGVNRTPNP